MRYLSVRVCMRSQGGTLDVGEGAEGTAPCDFVVVPVGRRVPPQGSSESGQGRQGGIGEPGGGQQRLGERQEGQGGGVLGGSGGQQGLGDTQHLLDGGGGITTEEWRVSCGPHKVCGWYFFILFFFFGGSGSTIEEWRKSCGPHKVCGEHCRYLNPFLFLGRWQHHRGVVGVLCAPQKMCGDHCRYLNPILFPGKWQHNRGVTGVLYAAQGVWRLFFLILFFFCFGRRWQSHKRVAGVCRPHKMCGEFLFYRFLLCENGRTAQTMVLWWGGG